MKKSDEKLLGLVDALCTIEQVKELLRLAKERNPKQVRITAETKSDLIQRNLRDALGSGGIGPANVFDLIRDAEENGNQHVLIRKNSRPPTPPKVATTTPTSEARRVSPATGY